MIDFYDAEFFFPLVPAVYRNLPGHKGSKPPKRRLKRTVTCSSWMGEQTVIFTPDSTRLLVCPQKVLGHWNCWGSDDLPLCVDLTAYAVLQRLGHCLTDDQESAIASGEYRLREVHIAQSFHLVNYSQQEFIRRLFYAIAESHQPEWARRGYGLVINGQNRRVSAYLYAKLQEFIARAWPRYQARWDASDAGTRIWVALSRNLHLLAAALGPRLEFRFGDQYFRHSPLARGTAWTPETAGRLYARELQHLKLPAAVDAMWRRDEAQQALTAAQFSTLRLWHHGEPLDSLGAKSTIMRHRAAILEGLGIDIRQPSATLVGRHRPLDVSAVLNVQNIPDMPEDADDGDNQELLFRTISRIRAEQ